MPWFPQLSLVFLAHCPREKAYQLMMIMRVSAHVYLARSDRRPRMLVRSSASANVDDDDSVSSGSQRFRCPFAVCPSASLSFAGWGSKQGLITHINNLHLACGELPSEEVLRSLGRSVCSPCKLLISSRGCPKCRGRSVGLLGAPRVEEPPPPPQQQQQQQQQQFGEITNSRGDCYDSRFNDSFPYVSQAIFCRRFGTLRHLPRAIRVEWAECLADCMSGCIRCSFSMQSLHQLFFFPKFTLYPLVRRGVHKRRQVERVLAERLREWREGNFQFLFAEMPGDQQRKYDLRPRGDSAMVVERLFRRSYGRLLFMR